MFTKKDSVAILNEKHNEQTLQKVIEVCSVFGKKCHLVVCAIASSPGFQLGCGV
jgi:hypothetical protein